jgi:hypothetical protein
MPSLAATPKADRVAINVEKGNGGDEEDPEDNTDNDANGGICFFLGRPFPYFEATARGIAPERDDYPCDELGKGDRRRGGIRAGACTLCAEKPIEQVAARWQDPL